MTSPKLAAQMAGTHATICVDGLIEFPTDDGPGYWACHGCAGCRTPHAPATRTRSADPFRGLPAVDDEVW